MAFLTALDNKVQSLLQGEPARIVAIGAIVIVWLATHLAFALGWAHQPPSFDEIEAAVSAAFLALNELVRYLVWSPSSVALLQAQTAAAATPVVSDPVIVDAPTTGNAIDPIDPADQPDASSDQVDDSGVAGG